MSQNLYVDRAFNSIEDAYSISNAEHVKGTNRYTFTFNDVWRNIYEEKLSVAIRSIKMFLRPRTIWLDGLLLADTSGESTQYYKISPVVSISGSMLEGNRLFYEDLKLHHEINSNIGLADYEIRYNPANNKLVFSILNKTNRYFIFDNNEDSVIVSPSYDLQIMTHQTDQTFWSDLALMSRGDSTARAKFESGTYAESFDYTLDESNHLVEFLFKNVFNRENLFVHSSLVDLSFDNFLGITNEQFIPPKTYPITYTNKKFWIELYDSLNEPVELPEDGADTIIIECIHNSKIQK